MSKNLRQLREKAATKGPSVKLKEIIPPKDNTVATQNFIKKHVVAHHEDPAGNGDDVYNASNIKPVKRSPEHGYDPGQDEEVYESAPPGKSGPHPIYHVLETAQKSADSLEGQVLLHHKENGKVKQYTIVDNDRTRGVSVYPLHRTKNDDMNIGGYPVISHAKIGKMLNSGASLHVTHHPKLTDEEEEDFHPHPSQELLTPLSNKGKILTQETRTGERKPIKPIKARKNRIGMYLNAESYQPKGKLLDSFTMSAEEFFSEKTLTPAEKAKREEIVLSMKKKNPKMPLGQIYAIATAQAIKVAESYEQKLKDERSREAKELFVKQKAIRAKYNAMNRKNTVLGKMLSALGLRKEEEDLLANLYNTLDEQNKALMLNLLDSEEGINNLIEFAVEKGID